MGLCELRRIPLPKLSDKSGLAPNGGRGPAKNGAKEPCLAMSGPRDARSRRPSAISQTVSPRRWVNKGPGPVGGGPGRTFRAVGCKLGRLSCAGHDQAEGLVRRLPPGDRVYDDCLIIPRLRHGRQAHASTQGRLRGGFHVGVAALLVVEVDHEAERSDTANLTPDSMRTHRA